MSADADTALGPSEGFPAVLITTTPMAYGDLTGDGRAEALLQTRCVPSAEGLGSGHGYQLLVVARDDGVT